MENTLKLTLVFLVFMAGIMTVTAYRSGYNLGYNRAKADDYSEYYSGPEGFCLADKPPHPGQCNDGE